ncbi:MAG: hypothetical protein IKS94_03285 [Prevotella sp.]|nr:hypothetical protein [Prevotella sp.]
MRPLNRLQNLLFLVGGILMVLGATAFVLMWHREVACWVFLVGAVLFAVIQSMQMYEGNNTTIRRLKKILNVADLFFILAAILMVDTVHHFLLPIFRSGGSDGYYTYIEYVYNKWVVLLLAAAILEVYATFRISSEFEREDGGKRR